MEDFDTSEITFIPLEDILGIQGVYNAHQLKEEMGIEPHKEVLRSDERILSATSSLIDFTPRVSVTFSVYSLYRTGSNDFVGSYISQKGEQGPLGALVSDNNKNVISSHYLGDINIE